MMGNLDKAGPSDPPLQSKHQTRALPPRKFLYTDQGKSLAFTLGGVAPRGSLHSQASTTS